MSLLLVPVAQLSILHLRAPTIQATLQEASKLPNAKRIRRTLRGSNSVVEPYPLMDLTAKQRKELAEARELDTAADTAASLARVSKPTPKQLQKLLISEAKKEALKSSKSPEKSQKETRKR